MLQNVCSLNIKSWLEIMTLLNKALSQECLKGEGKEGWIALYVSVMIIRM